MAKKKPEVKGMAGAQAILRELAAILDVDISGQYLADSPRHPTFKASKVPTHAEVLDHLAKGNNKSNNRKRRSLYSTEEDNNKAAIIVRDDIARHLQRTGRTTPDGKPVTTDKKQALAGGVAGVKKATEYLAAQMLKRLEAGSTTSGASAEKVTEQYAKSRNKEYGVNESVVYVASGQLANALASGKIKISINGLPK